MRRVVAMVLLLAGAGFLTGCGGSSSPIATSTHSASTAAAAGSPSAAPQATDQNGQTCGSLDSSGWCPGDDPTTCETVLDPNGWNNGPLTEVRAIGIVAAVLDTDFTGLIEGTLSDTEMHLLNLVGDAFKVEQPNSSGQLGQDSLNYANDESSYANGNGDTGPQDTAYAGQVSKDLIVLVKDCPHAYKLGKEMAAGQM
jgi:hypothetical protein